MPHTDRDLENVIRQALGISKAAGRDDMGQTVLAVQAVQRARPDMTAYDALAAVNLVQRPYSPVFYILLLLLNDAQEAF